MKFTERTQKQNRVRIEPYPALMLYVRLSLRNQLRTEPIADDPACILARGVAHGQEELIVSRIAGQLLASAGLAVILIRGARSERRPYVGERAAGRRVGRFVSAEDHFAG